MHNKLNAPAHSQSMPHTTVQPKGNEVAHGNDSSRYGTERGKPWRSLVAGSKELDNGCRPFTAWKSCGVYSISTEAVQ
jgi:hypothetical protein